VKRAAVDAEFVQMRQGLEPQVREMNLGIETKETFQNAEIVEFWDRLEEGNDEGTGRV
jgi:hypothetical protein